MSSEESRPPKADSSCVLLKAYFSTAAWSILTCSTCYCVSALLYYRRVFGLGLFLAVLLVRKGSNVSIVAHNEERLKKALETLEVCLTLPFNTKGWRSRTARSRYNLHVRLRAREYEKAQTHTED